MSISIEKKKKMTLGQIRFESEMEYDQVKKDIAEYFNLKEEDVTVDHDQAVDEFTIGNDLGVIEVVTKHTAFHNELESLNGDINELFEVTHEDRIGIYKKMNEYLYFRWM